MSKMCVYAEDTPIGGSFGQVLGQVRCFSDICCLSFPPQKTAQTIPRMPRNFQTLIAAARKVKRRAHAPFSRFRVGAALLSSDGRVYTGCNVESSSYGLTICAERTAIFKAISEGKRNFEAIAITSDGRGVTPPCGACRQVLWDLAGNITVILASNTGKPTVLKLESLLPIPFESKRLQTRKKRKI